MAAVNRRPEPLEAAEIVDVQQVAKALAGVQDDIADRDVAQAGVAHEAGPAAVAIDVVELTTAVLQERGERDLRTVPPGSSRFRRGLAISLMTINVSTMP